MAQGDPDRAFRLLTEGLRSNERYLYLSEESLEPFLVVDWPRTHELVRQFQPDVEFIEPLGPVLAYAMEHLGEYVPGMLARLETERRRRVIGDTTRKAAEQGNFPGAMSYWMRMSQPRKAALAGIPTLRVSCSIAGPRQC